MKFTSLTSVVITAIAMAGAVTASSIPVAPPGPQPVGALALRKVAPEKGTSEKETPPIPKRDDPPPPHGIGGPEGDAPPPPPYGVGGLKRDTPPPPPAGAGGPEGDAPPPPPPPPHGVGARTQLSEQSGAPNGDPDDESGGKQVEKGEFGIVGCSLLILFWSDFFDLWHSLKVPNDVDLLKALYAEGLQATAEEMPIPKAPSNVKKKGKRSAPRQRQAKITNTHLKGEIMRGNDLSLRSWTSHRMMGRLVFFGNSREYPTLILLDTIISHTVLRADSCNCAD
ncbi:hypothetical protein BDR04DRAFT_1143005 [Suillus decipiens]|nr:hypothetical protein BDR04DRAFT_1143005 [Suillus decipiens]